MTKIHGNDDHCSSVIRNRLWKGLLCSAIAVFAAVQIVLFAPQSAQAQVRDITSGAEFSNPPSLDLDLEMVDDSPHLTGELNAKWIKHTTIYNPATGVEDEVKLRGYEGMETGAYVGRTISVDPGDHLEITLRNELGEEGQGNCPPDDENPDMNKPHCFNTTNLHTHGFYVSPTQDDVLRRLEPGVDSETSYPETLYTYDIPKNHPAGTFWYHPHVHGSTALQASSGMAGALIVNGNRQPAFDDDGNVKGDIDTLIPDVTNNSKILVFQQIQYACFDDDNGGVLKTTTEGTDANGNPITIGWRCDPGDTGELRGYEDADTNGPTSLFGPSTWDQSGRLTSINGLIRPDFTATVGEIQRWRMIHAGVRDTIGLQFVKSNTGRLVPEKFRSLSRSGLDDFINTNCTGSNPIDYHVIANDGLTRAKAWKTNLETLQPGYRSDALVVFPDAGDYCVLDASAPNEIFGSANRQLLGVVHVRPRDTGSIGNIHDYLKRQLVIKALSNLSTNPLLPKIINDINNDISLTYFTPHEDIEPEDVNGFQELTFNIQTKPTPSIYEISNSIKKNQSDDDLTDFHSFDATETNRKLPLGQTEQWTLESKFASHPFHIHINPFQIVSITDPNGKEVSGPNDIDDIMVDDNPPGTVDPQYRGLKWVWKDTLWVKNVGTQKNDETSINKGGRYRVVVRTRYEGDFIGPFVLHCHILDHEDQGMMQKICITNKPGNENPPECEYEYTDPST